MPIARCPNFPWFVEISARIVPLLLAALLVTTVAIFFSFVFIALNNF
jgi:hypothetical protein